MQMNEDVICYWLSVSGVNARRFNALVSAYSLAELWEEIGKSLTDRNLFGEKTYDALIRYRNEEFLSQSIDRLHEMDISFLSYNRYPTYLSQKEVHPPAILYYRGNPELLRTNCIAIVGTRNCSSYGKEATTRLATDLCACNLTVVSGLATGVDMYAHRAAVKTGGKTIAVLGSGHNCFSPTSNMGLFHDILASGGLIVSEYVPSCVATRYTFPERNRIISGLSMGVVVVEAGQRSGALITSDFAAEQGRTVFAVPGNITSSRSIGSNRLIYDGAIPALSATDICETLNLPVPGANKNSRVIQLDIFEQKIYNILTFSRESYDSLVLKSEMEPPKLSALLSALEIKGIIKKIANMYSLA